MTVTAQQRLASAQPTTLHSSYEEDLDNYATLGYAGIGLWEVQMPDRPEADLLSRFKDSGLRASFCFPHAPGIVAGNGTWFSQPRDPDERLRMLLASIRRFARYEPEAVVCLAGAPRGDVVQQRKDVIAALREAAIVAEGEGVTLALEIIRPGIADSIVGTIEAGVEFISEIGVDSMKLLADAWHTAGSPELEAQVEKYASYLAGIQLCDRKPESRGWYDRALPGEGELRVAEFVAAAERGGYTGLYEMELFSDDGTFGNDYPDSYWKLPPLEVLEQVKRTSLLTLETAGVGVASARA